MNRAEKIYVAGHRGLVGSAVVRALRARGFDNLLLRTSSQLDLTRQREVLEFFSRERPDRVVLAAAVVGGINANDSYPADFIYGNLAIQTNVIHSAHLHGVRRLLFLGSSCIYPKLCPQPIKEEYLLTGPLEPTNDAYALAKIAGIGMCRAYNRQYGADFSPVMPTNLYGINDNFDLENAHVLPALMRKFHEAKASGAKSVAIWGTGTPRREFLHVDDLARACVLLLGMDGCRETVNVGCGADVTIRELAELLAETVGYRGELSFDRSKPDGTPQKLLDIGKISALGWRPEIGLREGLRSTYAWFLENQEAWTRASRLNTAAAGGAPR